MMGVTYEYRRKNKWHIPYREKEADVDIDRYRGEGEIDTPENVICSKFGCGKILTLSEQLFGKRCQGHQEIETTLNMIDKHLSL